MKTKTFFNLLLLGFVAVSVAFAFRKLSPTSPTVPPQTETTTSAETPAAPIGLDENLAATQFSAVYFHAAHRCVTCRKIENFAQEALEPEIKAGKLAWQTADYTSAENATLVDQLKVFTSTVVLVEVEDGKVVRWKNLKEVWDHTSNQQDFTAYINQAWSEFKTS